MNNRNEEITAMNLRVLKQINELKRTEKIMRVVKFTVLARYDEDSKQWNYLKIKGPLFLVIDSWGMHRLVVLNHDSPENRIIPVNKESGIKIEAIKLEHSEGYMLNYMIDDSITKRSIFGIWSAD